MSRPLLATDCCGTCQEYLTVREMPIGACFRCQRLRLAAAIEYIRAADLTRLLDAAGVRYTTTGHHVLPVTNDLTRAIMRTRSADLRCIELRMWTGDRPVPRGDEE